MKRIITVLLTTGLLAALAACDRERTTYSDAEYVMFADTMSVNMVLQDQEYFAVTVASTTACDYDRNFGVEVLDERSKAIEGVHYRLKSNTITIPAGRRTADVLVHGCYDELEAGDTLGFALRLVMPEQLKWELYGDRTHVKMVKSCPFAIDDYTGWCMVTSAFLQSFPGVENTSIQRLVRTERHPTEENAIVIRNWLFTGYDVTLRFDASDPAEPKVLMDEDQVLSDEESVFGKINGDNKILATTSPAYLSYFSSCENFVSLWIHVYVKNLGTPVGTVGNYLNILEWVSDEEAERLQKEEGM
ncbi:MAG: DUF4984 domain-containing protein [Alistipes sp.]|nr:DUF4984 domain-containing protein [Alistipes senegalensis]MCM1249880.1 DUF4984 domain-containing protein [Alistipes sp.]